MLRKSLDSRLRGNDGFWPSLRVFISAGFDFFQHPVRLQVPLFPHSHSFAPMKFLKLSRRNGPFRIQGLEADRDICFQRHVQRCFSQLRPQGAHRAAVSSQRGRPDQHWRRSIYWCQFLDSSSGFFVTIERSCYFHWGTGPHYRLLHHFGGLQGSYRAGRANGTLCLHFWITSTSISDRRKPIIAQGITDVAPVHIREGHGWARGWWFCPGSQSADVQ